MLESTCYEFTWKETPAPGKNYCPEHLDQLHRLDERTKHQKAIIAEMQETLRAKNLALDALHWVWCDGGCTGGCHRFTEGKITEEHVLIAERNVRRMRAWFRNAAYRHEHYPDRYTDGPLSFMTRSDLLREAWKFLKLALWRSR